LALALIERGHAVQALVPQQGRRGAAREEVLGVPALRWGYRAPRIPFVQNYFRHERLWPRLADALVELAVADDRPLTTDHRPLWGCEDRRSSVVGRRSSIVIHAQHVQVAPPSVMAGRRLGVPVVVTVRDHWPWDYFATGLHGDRMPLEHQTWTSLATDLPIRLGPLRGALALPAIPYLLAHLRRRQQFLRQADAVIAVSDYIARRLAGIVAPERLHVIPNMLDLAAIDAAAAQSPASVAPSTPYLLYVGKLERNKGAHLLIDIFRDWRLEIGDNHASNPQSPISNLQLVVAGSGSLRPELERELTALGVQVRFLDWIEHDETLRLMAHCQLLLFPSSWGEPLSRVLLEGMACGAPILAMPTGGTSSALRDGVDGALEPTPAGFARRMATLLARPEQRVALGAAARRAARARYAKETVVGQVEVLYAALRR
jgi:glycosyltransferase involved in cell wall biosynthesis